MTQSPQIRVRQSAQIIPLFALGLLAFLAMIAVVIDGGTLYLQRRTAQNAADAAALAGARALQRATLQSTGSIGDGICTYLRSNAFGVTPTAAAYFVAANGTTNLGPISVGSTCGASPASFIPPGASGVHVDATVGPYNTYLAGIVGIRQLTATASATAQVGVLSIPAASLSPLAGCGPDMLVNGQSPTPYINILTEQNTIRPELYDPPIDVLLEGSQMAQNEVAPQGTGCPAWNTTSSAWKGQVDIDGVTGNLTPPLSLPVDTGNSSIDDEIVNTCKSIYGAAAGDPTGKDASNSNCYLLIPIAAPPNPSNQANIVTLACFRLYDGGNGYQKWRGVLVRISDGYCSYGTYLPTWQWGNTFDETQVVLTM